MVKKEAKTKDRIAELETKLARLGEKGKEGKEKVDVLNQLSYEYHTRDSEKALEYATQALELSQILKYPEGKAQSELNFGRCNIEKKKYEEAIESTQNALKYFERIDDKKQMANCCYYLGVIFEGTSDYERGLGYYQKALKLRKETKDKEGIASVYNQIGRIYSTLGDYDKALENLHKYLKISEQIDSKKGIANAYIYMGNVYRGQGEYDKALESYFKSVESYEEIDYKYGIASCLNNIGIVNSILGKFEKALQYCLKSLKLREEVGDRHEIAASYNNIGNLYRKEGDFEKALEYHTNALGIRKEIGDETGIGTSYGNIGLICEDQGNYEKALGNLLLALEFFKKHKNKPFLTYCYTSIGSVYIKLKRLDEAEKNLKKSIEIALEIGAKQQQMDAYHKLYELNEIQKNYEGAYEYYKKTSEIKEKIFSEESESKITQLRLRFETEQKAKEAEIYRLKNEELEKMVAERTEELEKELADRKRIEEELKEKLALIEQQRAAILELSTPTIKVWDGVLVVPLIGILDSKRAQHLTEELLTSIAATQSKIAIIDITGVPTVDSAVANHLVKTIESVNLLGAACVVTGIKPDVAQTVIHLGIDITKLETKATLAEGLKWAFRSIGLDKGVSHA